MIIRMVTAFLLALIALIPTGFYYGGAIEAKLLPVLSIEAVDLRYGEVEIEGRKRNVIFFKTHVIKQRRCRLDVFSFRWLLDHSVAVSPVYVAEDNLPFQPNSVITTGEFTSRELWTAIPEAAYNYPITIFRGTTWFWCHPLWPLAFDFELQLDLETNLKDLRSEIERSSPSRVVQNQGFNY